MRALMLPQRSGKGLRTRTTLEFPERVTKCSRRKPPSAFNPYVKGWFSFNCWLIGPRMNNHHLRPCQGWQVALSCKTHTHPVLCFEILTRAGDSKSVCRISTEARRSHSWSDTDSSDLTSICKTIAEVSWLRAELESLSFSCDSSDNFLGLLPPPLEKPPPHNLLLQLTEHLHLQQRQWGITKQTAFKWKPIAARLSLFREHISGWGKVSQR